jgi:hypothetical protein
VKDIFINTSIDVGFRHGIDALDRGQRLVYLISEPEVLCDIEGIDSFLDQYFRNGRETATAFAVVGAAEIAEGPRTITADTMRDNPLLDKRPHY